MSYKWLEEDEWLRWRENYVTATTGAQLLGLDPYGSPNKALKERISPSPFKGNAYTLVGKWLEQTVIDASNHFLNANFESCIKTTDDEGYTLFDKNGRIIRKVLFYYNNKTKIGASPDAMEDDVFLECKTVNKSASYARYAFHPPEKYLMQLQQQMYCANIKLGYLAIMHTDLTQTSPCLNFPLSVFKVHYRERLGKLLEQEVARFWKAFQNKEKDLRVDSAVKAEAKQLIQNCYKKVI